RCRPAPDAESPPLAGDDGGAVGWRHPGLFRTGCPPRGTEVVHSRAAVRRGTADRVGRTLRRAPRARGELLRLVTTPGGARVIPVSSNPLRGTGTQPRNNSANRRSSSSFKSETTQTVRPLSVQWIRW